MTEQNGLERSSATERISAMLDERGKEHRVWPSGLVIWHDEGSWVYEYSPPKGDDDYWGGILHATLRHCTPEQAIEATLGSDLEAENAELRELMRDMLSELDAATQYDAGGGRGVVYEFTDRMRELGIEVE